MTSRIWGFLKVRNEIIREGNLGRVLTELGALTHGGVICDDASTDGTWEALQAWVAAQNVGYSPGRWVLMREPRSSFGNEIAVKQRMLDELHKLARVVGAPDWIFWLDGDELLDTGVRQFREYVESLPREVNNVAFHYTQLWRSTRWARTDAGFDEGWFWKLWRYRPELRFFGDDGTLHRPQFPENDYKDIMHAVSRGGYSKGPCRRAPFEIIHVGNAGKNLQWKVHQYCNSGKHAKESLARHLYFREPQYRKVDANFTLYPHMDPKDETPPMPFNKQETALIERLGDMKKVPDLFVVIVPTFNRAYALPKTLESVRRQTIDNWCCVVLDDGSTDKTPQLMRELQDADPRFFYCRYENNRGGVMMNEIGMALAADFGSYWTRLGSDDFFEPHKLELDWLAFKLGAKATWGPYHDFRDDVGLVQGGIRGTPMAARTALLGGGFACSWANVAVSVDVLDKTQTRHTTFCDPRIRNMEDYLVNVRLARFADFTWRGQLKDGRFCFGDAPVKGPEMVHDAIWRIGADGASNKPDQINHDEMFTREAIALDNAKFPLALEPALALPKHRTFASVREAWASVGGRPK